jgi:hypothetical protein
LLFSGMQHCILWWTCNNILGELSVSLTTVERFQLVPSKHWYLSPKLYRITSLSIIYILIIFSHPFLSILNFPNTKFNIIFQFFAQPPSFYIYIYIYIYILI